ncbi:uncharacterized protein LOC117782023 [Drosophila innubila]|uniref:uncharacterized protein LOC117782023 n=1 Tax=Drosophila innubila TaxID=198719 RepID=UPI00148DE832|nr:uncharacterized protein LOC117782023 [Drosophila innubila]
MCICSACSSVDNCCGPLDKKAEFFACWTFVHGIIYTILCLRYDLNYKDYAHFGYVFWIPHMLAGLLMMYSIYKKQASLYLWSLIASSFVPFIFFLFVYLPIFQIFFIIVGCRYYSTALI